MHDCAPPNEGSEHGPTGGNTIGAADDDPMGAGPTPHPTAIDHIDWAWDPPGVRPATAGVRARRWFVQRWSFTVALTLALAAHAAACGVLYGLLALQPPPEVEQPKLVLSIGTHGVPERAIRQREPPMPPSDRSRRETPTDWPSPDPSRASTAEPSPFSDAPASTAAPPTFGTAPARGVGPRAASTAPWAMPADLETDATTPPAQARPARAVAGGPRSPSSAAPVVSAPSVAGRERQFGAANGYDSRGLPVPDYPAEARRRHEQGLVVLDVEVLPTGRAGTITVVSSTASARLDEAAIAAVRGAVFDAATRAGSPVVGHLRIPFRFVLGR